MRGTGGKQCVHTASRPSFASMRKRAGANRQRGRAALIYTLEEGGNHEAPNRSSTARASCAKSFSVNPGQPLSARRHTGSMAL